MKLNAYSIRDQHIAFNLPWFARTHGEAERKFQDLINDKQSYVSKYPEHYDLYWIGEFDDETGVITPMDTPRHMAKAVNLVQVETASRQLEMSAVQ